MAEQSWPQRHWKLIVNLVTIVALVALVYFIRDDIVSTFRNIDHVNAWWLLLLLPVEFLNYHAQARLYQRLFAIVGNKLSYKYLFTASLELNFVNHVFPSGGVTGLSYFTLRLREGKELSEGKATFIHVMKIALYFIAFEAILVFGVFALATMGRVNNLVMLTAGSISTLLVVGTLGFMYIIGSKYRINSFFVGLTRALNRLIRLVRPRNPEPINIEGARKIFDDFHESYMEIRKNYRQLKMPFYYALLADATEIGAVYVVYIAFGEWVNIGAVILAYGIANFAGLVSVLPGGVGIYEALMTTVLAATGIPPALSLPVTIMYRILNTLIQVPPGYYLYHRAIRRGDLSAGVTHAE
ncbi:MAG TPA: lysylphosphatidylglycerol synthase transmembrane domain-containing protein [Candidatus Saccharimonadales bacterium]|nr:lysylphosphatidylglycerol synthase transmembrane domain-containing protein [Candidatus Saccharimonadales bacterium]